MKDIKCRHWARTVDAEKTNGCFRVSGVDYRTVPEETHECNFRWYWPLFCIWSRQHRDGAPFVFISLADGAINRRQPVCNEISINNFNGNLMLRKSTAQRFTTQYISPIRFKFRTFTIARVSFYCTIEGARAHIQTHSSHLLRPIYSDYILMMNGNGNGVRRLRSTRYAIY